MLESIIGLLGTVGIILAETGQRLGMNTSSIADSPLSGYGSSSGSTTVFNLAFAPLVDHLGPLMQNIGGILSSLANILQQNGA